MDRPYGTVQQHFSPKASPWKEISAHGLYGPTTLGCTAVYSLINVGTNLAILCCPNSYVQYIVINFYTVHLLLAGAEADLTAFSIMS